MKKLFIGGTLLFVFLAYSFHENGEGGRVSAPQAPSTPSGDQNTSSNNSTNSSPNPTTPLVQQTSYKDGSYTGPSTDAYYGNIQVKATITGGKISDVQFLDYPHDRGESIRINSEAMPILRQEAIQAQSAQVDIVGGATQSSMAFQTSLASALSQAK